MAANQEILEDNDHLYIFFLDLTCAHIDKMKQPKYWKPVYQMDKLMIYLEMFLWNYFWNNQIWVLQIYFHKGEFCILEVVKTHIITHISLT